MPPLAVPTRSSDAAPPPPVVVVPPCMAKRWLPVQHTSSGTATFFHALPHDTRPEQLGGAAQVGGELMVGSMVQAAPACCLAALQDSRCGNSILGPATHQQRLPFQQQQQEAAGSDGVLVLHLAPLSSWFSAGSWGCCFSRLLCACLAPRCAVLQWSLRHDARGVDCLVFRSLPEQQARAVLDRQRLQGANGCSSSSSAPHPMYNSRGGLRGRLCLQPPWAQRHQHQQQRSLFTALLQLFGSVLLLVARWMLGCSNSSSCSLSLSCLWLPVVVTVTGAYTVAGLEGVDGEGSPTQSLVTAIIKADLGGWLSGPAQQQQQQRGSGVLYRLAVWSGVVDALLQQLTSGVERAKAELSGQPGGSHHHQHQHPPSAGAAVTFTGRQQVGGGSRCGGGSSWVNAAALVQALLAAVGSLADSVLTPLAAWQAPQPPQQPQQRRPWWAAVLSAAAWPLPATSPDSFVGRSGSGSISASDAALSDAAAALVGRGSLGQPLTGFCDRAFWSPLHEPGWPQPFHVRGPTYLSDRAKVPAGSCAFTLLAVDLVSTSDAAHHIARFLPSVRRARAASCFVINLMVPTAADVLNLVMTFGSAQPFPAPAPASAVAAAAPPPGSDSDDGGISSGFVHALQRFLAAGDGERSHVLKLIPRIQVGPWMLQQAVGTTPVIVGRKLQTSFHCTDRYVEIDIDVTTCKSASFIVQSIRGMTASLVVDLAFLLEGRRPDELPEVLLGAVRLTNLDMGATTPLAVDAPEGAAEVPPWPAPWTSMTRA